MQDDILYNSDQGKLMVGLYRKDLKGYESVEFKELAGECEGSPKSGIS